MSSLAQKLEQAVIAVLQADPDVAALGRNIYPAQRNAQLVLDAIIVAADEKSGREEPIGLGNWHEPVSVEVRTSSSRADPADPNEDRGPVHDAAAEAVEKALSSTSLAADLSAAVADFTAYDPVYGRTNGGRAASDRQFRTRFEFMVFCCATDLSSPPPP